MFPVENILTCLRNLTTALQFHNISQPWSLLKLKIVIFEFLETFLIRYDPLDILSKIALYFEKIHRKGPGVQYPLKRSLGIIMYFVQQNEVLMHIYIVIVSETDLT